VLDCKGSGSWSGIVAGIDWVTGDHTQGTPAVANMSLGGGISSAVDNAVNNSIADGVTYVVAAGNGNRAGVGQNACNYSPARVGAAITVGATDSTDAKSTWSNFGTCVDWFAPGVSITSAGFSKTSTGATATMSGTSMASPHTAGVVALYLQSTPSASPAAVRNALAGKLTPNVLNVKSIGSGSPNALLSSNV
jgi:subtilisin family serine protease